MNALLFAIATAFIGAALAHFFQTRIWTFQQQRRIQEEQLTTLRDTISELSHAIFEKLSVSQQLIAAVGTNDADWINKSLERYRESLEEFRITWLKSAVIITREESDGFDKVRRFEDEILTRMADLGASIEGAVRLSRSGKPRKMSNESRQIRELNHLSFAFVRDMYASFQTIRNDTLIIDIQKLSKKSIYNLDTWNLFKLLFVRPDTSQY